MAGRRSERRRHSPDPRPPWACRRTEHRTVRRRQAPNLRLEHHLAGLRHQVAGRRSERRRHSPDPRPPRRCRSNGASDGTPASGAESSTGASSGGASASSGWSSIGASSAFAGSAASVGAVLNGASDGTPASGAGPSTGASSGGASASSGWSSIGASSAFAGSAASAGVSSNGASDGTPASGAESSTGASSGGASASSGWSSIGASSTFAGSAASVARRLTEHRTVRRRQAPNLRLEHHLAGLRHQVAGRRSGRRWKLPAALLPGRQNLHRRRRYPTPRTLPILWNEEEHSGRLPVA